jgi:hypothetical protein
MVHEPAPRDERAYPSAPAFTAPVRIGQSETQILATAATTAAIRDALATSGGAVFHDVLEPSLLQSLCGVARKAAFRQVDLEAYGLRGNDLSPSSALPFCITLARPAFMAWLEAIGGGDRIGHIEGHLVEMKPGNSLGWHRDAGLGIRRLALVLNLTEQPYQGGEFELRRRAPREPMLTYHAGTTGSLAVFRLGRNLEHQVTQVTSGGPRTTFSAWARGPRCAGDAMRDGALCTWPPLAASAAGDL